MEEKVTYFCTEDGKILGSEPGILPVHLFKGMRITLDTTHRAYRVVDWSYHKGMAEKQPGLSRSNLAGVRQQAVVDRAE